jgi:colanic acid/amylovoran biosynthesis glycosyltransferase
MRKAAMLVLPSVRTSNGRVEGLSVVMLEAAATGVPVVGSRIGGIPDGVVDGETGLLAPERDADALAQCIGALLDDPAARLGMNVRARAHIEARFDIRRQTELLEGFYDSVLSAQRPGPP